MNNQSIIPSVYYAGIGSRETPEWVLFEMTRIASFLESRGFILRSGGAPGADTAFQQGTTHLREIYIPWPGFQDLKPNGVDILDLKTLPLQDESFASISQYHPAPDRLSSGALKLMQRNWYQVFGRNHQPSSFVICWTRGGSGAGGTGQAIRMAKDAGATIFDLGVFGDKSEYDQHIREWIVQMLRIAKNAQAQ